MPVEADIQNARRVQNQPDYNNREAFSQRPRLPATMLPLKIVIPQRFEANQ
jgi:hypothetical protein